MPTLTLKEINSLDIVDFLSLIGHHPEKVSGHNYWYLSPLPDRFEKTPSFKVNRRLNRWKDFGNGTGSTLVDFGILYYNCTIRELVLRLSGPFSGSFSTPLVSPQNVSHNRYVKDDTTDAKIEIMETRPVRSFYLIRYLWERRITLPVAQKYCVEVHYRVRNKVYYALGFRSNDGGYELRNKFFKGSSAPKGITFIDNGSFEIAVFEGFFDILTFLTFMNCPDHGLPNLLVLNSTSHLEKSMETLKRHHRAHFFLDNDETGDRCTDIAERILPGFSDHRTLYNGYKDLNEWACSIGKVMIPSLNADAPLKGSGP